MGIIGRKALPILNNLKKRDSADLLGQGAPLPPGEAPGGLVLTSVDKVLDWGRANSLWYLRAETSTASARSSARRLARRT
jgi:hypothetical protein